MFMRLVTLAAALSCMAFQARPTSVSATLPAAHPVPTTSPTMVEKSQALADSWKDRLSAERFNVVVAAPFVIAGDGTAAQLARYRDGTVLAAARAMGKQFFTTPPDEPVLILLFESEEPYKRLAKEWFGAADVPHYGFYRHGDHVMLMNVATGTGTLVHELAHALIAPDFPQVPAWFNEGLASLYEQSRFGADGESIRGLPNWRLPALQKAIKADTLRSLSEMIADDDFRNDERVGINYAEARYLMYYLQEKKLLQRFYTDFRAGHADDPTGIETLKKVIEPQSLEVFEKDWRAWVTTLRFE